MATKNIHIHLPALLKKPVKARDASSPAQIEKEIANQQRLISAMEKNGKDAGSLKQRLKFLQEELQKVKAKENTEDAREQRFGLPVYTEEEIKQKIRNGEWEAETDVVKGKRVELRNGSKRFQVYVKDAESQQGMSQRRQRLIAALKKHGFSEAAASVEAKQYMSIPDMAKLERGLTEKGYSLDAGFTTYDPREAKRLDDEIKEVKAQIKVTKSPFGKKDLEQILEKLKKERAKYRS